MTIKRTYPQEDEADLLVQFGVQGVDYELDNKGDVVKLEEVDA